MNLQQLEALGGFVPRAPVAREVAWTRPGADGEPVTDVFSVRVKKLSAGDIDCIATARLRLGATTEASWRALVISQAILLGEDGAERFTYQQAYQLDHGLARLLVEAIDAVSAGAVTSTQPAELAAESETDA